MRAPSCFAPVSGIMALMCRAVALESQQIRGLVVCSATTLQTYGTNKYKRTLADVLLPDGTHVNPVLVKDG